MTSEVTLCVSKKNWTKNVVEELCSKFFLDMIVHGYHSQKTSAELFSDPFCVQEFSYKFECSVQNMNIVYETAEFRSIISKTAHTFSKKYFPSANTRLAGCLKYNFLGLSEKFLGDLTCLIFDRMNAVISAWIIKNNLCDLNLSSCDKISSAFFMLHVRGIIIKICF